MTLKRQTQFRLSPFEMLQERDERDPGSGSRRTQKVQSRKRIEILPIYGGQPID
jgi:hypothetical protein